jgi:hypothetical protein
MRIILKKYPADYSNEVLTVIKAMSFTSGKGVKLVGSYTLRNQVYAGDVDALELVPIKSVNECVKRFQDVVKNVVNIPFTYISDIKCGSVEEWRVVPTNAKIVEGKVEGYDSGAILGKVKHLHDTKIISDEQFMVAKRMLKNHVNAVEFLALQKELRYNIIRWSLKDMIAGYKILQDGRKYTLAEGVQSPTISKLDVVSWVSGNHFTDFEMIYEFKLRGHIINKGLRDLDIAIRESVLLMRREGNYFKMAKRMYALARYYDYKHDLKPLNDLFIGDLGRLYGIYGDANSLKYLIENVDDLPKDKIEYEVDQFVGRLSNVVIPTYLRREATIMSIVNRLKNPQIYTHDNQTMLKLLDSLRFQIFSILSNYTLRYLKTERLFPVSAKYLP